MALRARLGEAPAADPAPPLPLELSRKRYTYMYVYIYIYMYIYIYTHTYTYTYTYHIHIHIHVHIHIHIHIHTYMYSRCPEVAHPRSASALSRIQRRIAARNSRWRQPVWTSMKSEGDRKSPPSLRTFCSCLHSA